MGARWQIGGGALSWIGRRDRMLETQQQVGVGTACLKEGQQVGGGAADWRRVRRLEGGQQNVSRSPGWGWGKSWGWGNRLWQRLT